MKKRLLTLLTAAMLCGVVSGCCVSHDWQEATCTAPKTCAKCGETEGEPLPHTWVEATCTEAKHCSVCGTTEGEPLPHEWVEATYETPKTCSVCGATEGEPKEFTVEDANQRFVQAIDVYQKNWINFTDEQMQDPEYILRADIIQCMLLYASEYYKDELENLNIKTKDNIIISFNKSVENGDLTGNDLHLFKCRLFEKFMIEAVENNNEISLIDYIENHNFNEILKDTDMDEYMMIDTSYYTNTEYGSFPLMYDYLMEQKMEDPKIIDVQISERYGTEQCARDLDGVCAKFIADFNFEYPYNPENLDEKNNSIYFKENGYILY